MNPLSVYGLAAVNYMRANTASLVATAGVAAGWSAAATMGIKVVTGTCLVGGGMFATFVAHEVIKTSLSTLGRAFINATKVLERKAKEAQPDPGIERVA